MEDLECYIDNSLVFGEGGKIIARKGGIRRYIQSEIPDLYKSYKTLMRYKALARKFRQAVGISDPVPAASVLPKENGNVDVGTDADVYVLKCAKPVKNIEKDEIKARSKGMSAVENMVRTNSQGGVVRGWNDDDSGESTLSYDSVNGETVSGGEDAGGVTTGKGSSGRSRCRRGESERLNDEIRRVVKEILDVCEGTFLNLSAVVALRICEDTIPHRSYQSARREICA
jgi:hypothetical protein